MTSPEPNSVEPPAPRFALWNLGFRPFYLLAGAFAALSILFWTAQFARWTGTSVYLGDPRWHAHEMIFGYAFAVIVGFLFTAGRNWTNRPTPTGLALAAVAALWLAARVLVLTPWHDFAAIADTAFAIAASVGMAVPLLASRNRRNYFFVPLLLAFGAANLAFYLSMAGVIDFSMQRALQVALDLILFVVAVMAGRVVPMFTNNAIPGARASRRSWLEHVVLGSTLCVFAADALNLPAAVIAAIAVIAALAHAARLGLWKSWVTARYPIVWILHLSYAWIAIHLLLRALAALGLVPETLATHALTVGAIGGITIGMMTRTSRGHTGRPLRASAMETASYVLVHVGAAVRVFLPLAVPEMQLGAIVASGVLWSAAFALFTIAFWPILTRARLDGKPG
ncbi:MAG: NnrS family protein [Betaproteobacteria bacterium RIFCSPLOWO2_12_FULL_63_13]|nr:MAG: NnrS family protein [Betaproteobacteria bacterium RIFCSPLOWO2_02_FULL_63_19]OGA42762.1 MAG: NnrS family protein [Betaproteobacteria bacterium RIFCSPLOWO2_12_FULL_63_13]